MIYIITLYASNVALWNCDSNCLCPVILPYFMLHPFLSPVLSLNWVCFRFNMQSKKARMFIFDSTNIPLACQGCLSCLIVTKNG